MAAPTSDESEDFLNCFSEIALDPPNHRDMCGRCRRPCSVCWCPFLPQQRLTVATSIYILQHPFEESRNLKTVPMLEQSLAPGKCHIYRGRRFGGQKYADVHKILEAPNTLLLFPGPRAVDLSSVVAEHESFNIVLLDGTWSQAKGIYLQNPCLHGLKQVQFETGSLSEYKIRTQPNDSALSTLETAALALSTLENRPEIQEILLKPLKALCNFQLHYGSLEHHSKKYLIDNGLYRKQALPVNSRKDTVKKKTPSNMEDDKTGQDHLSDNIKS